MAENIFANALIPFIGVRKKQKNKRREL